MPKLQALGVPARFLNAKLSSVVPSQPMSWVEQLILGKWFRHERLSLGPTQSWLNRQWELRLGSVKGAIYKVGLETVAGEYEEAVEFASQVGQLIDDTFGKATERGEGLWMWDADDGNVILQISNVMGERRVMVFLTSRAAEHFRRQ